jgi:hypothetical protein
MWQKGNARFAFGNIAGNALMDNFFDSLRTKVIRHERNNEKVSSTPVGCDVIGCR